MNKPLLNKTRKAISRLRQMWKATEGKTRFVAFSTGKDSLAMAAMLYEALSSESPVCLYSHHRLEFPENIEYAERLREYGFRIEVVHPFLDYFGLIRRGIGFITLYDPWCVPMLVGTGIMEWLQHQAVKSTRNAVMFRGMTGSEFSRKYHLEYEVYRKLDIPCFNPMLEFTRNEIVEIIRDRYGLPLNPLYEHMDRSYCICCYTADQKRQDYARKRFPTVCSRYYRQIDRMLFASGLLMKHHAQSEFVDREEKLSRHGFVHWRRVPTQDQIGAAKDRLANGVWRYSIRDPSWIDEKHLKPLQGQWIRNGAEIRIWGVPETKADAVIKRMINCLDCGFCVVQCLVHRRFDRKRKQLLIGDCVGCRRCARLGYCMGWKHRFWRRIIYER